MKNQSINTWEKILHCAYEKNYTLGIELLEKREKILIQTFNEICQENDFETFPQTWRLIFQFIPPVEACVLPMNKSDIQKRIKGRDVDKRKGKFFSLF